MARPNIEDQGKIRLKNGPQLVHIIGVADARLHDPKRFLAGRRQHGQRQADLVVQVHVRLGGKPAAAQDLREQFLDRGFAAVPVSPITRVSPRRSRQQCASFPSALTVSSTRMSGTGGTASNGFRDTSSAAAPASMALTAKSCPSNVSPGMQTNRDPGFTARLSVPHAFHDAARRGSRHGGTRPRRGQSLQNSGASQNLPDGLLIC